MIPSLLEGVLAALVAILFVYLWRKGRQRPDLSGPGWRYILTGLALLVAGGALRAVVAWPDIQQVMGFGNVVEGVLAYTVKVAGLLSLVTGLFLWVPQATSFEKLRQTEEKYRALVETTSDWVWELDENIRYTYVSPRIKDYLGYAPEEVLGKTPFDFMPAEEARWVASFFDQIVSSRRAFRGLEIIDRHKDGHRILKETSGLPIVDDEGRFRGYRGCDRDVTQQRWAAEELAASEKRYRFITENVSDVIWTTDMELGVQYVSPAVERLLGFTPKETASLSLDELMTPASAERAMTVLTERLAAAQYDPALWKRPISIELEFRRKDGTTLWADVNASVILAENDVPTGLVGVARDMTVRRANEDELQRIRGAVEVVRRNGRQLLANLVHEVRTSVTAILGYADLVEDGCPQQCDFGERTLREHVETIRRNADHLLAVFGEVLDFSPGASEDDEDSPLADELSSAAL
ncbi:MAG: PAS domain S-box protein [Pirellulales bacterium]|nr:PAS domain S-box protein [Pirellulales bacterium]